MAETYCGKTCAECSTKDTLNCPGCKAGPGMSVGGSCELARCARSRGHAACERCNFQAHCGTLRSRDKIPEQRRLKAQIEEARLADIAKRAPILKRWLWVLFWLIIPNTLASVITNTTVTNRFPALYMPGLILGTGCTIVYGVVLLLLSGQHDRYRTAGICRLISGAINLVSVFAQNSAPIVLILSVAAAIAVIIGTYQEFSAHSTVLTGADNALSDLWSSLWKWYIGSIAAILGSIVLTPISPVLGMLVLLAASIVSLIVGIVNLVFLYNTAKVFSSYCHSCASTPSV